MKLPFFIMFPSIDEIVLAMYVDWIKIPQCQMGVKKCWCQNNIIQISYGNG